MKREVKKMEKLNEGLNEEQLIQVILGELNEEQRKAVETIDGNIRVIAGPRNRQNVSNSCKVYLFNI